MIGDSLRRLTPSVRCGALVAFIVVAGIALAGCSAKSEDPATADAKAACATLDRMGTPRFGKNDVSMDEFGAAVELATAAAGRDAKYKPLEDALFAAQAAVNRTFKADNPTTRSNLAKARKLCKDI